MYLISAKHVRRAAFATVLCTFGTLSLAYPSQQGADRPAGGSIRATSIAVEVYAIVEGRRGRLIEDLKKDDFELTDEGTPQKIEYFSDDTHSALSLGLAIDTSASQGRLLRNEQAAAKQFLRAVLREGDQAFVMNFDVDVKLLEDFTGKASELARAVESTEINDTGRSVLDANAAPVGGTHLYDAVYLASDQLMRARHGRKALVLVTDGEDQGSKIRLEDSIASAEKANVIVYSIIVSDPEFYSLMGGAYRGDAKIRRLTRQTGGRTIRVKSVENIGAAFGDIARELHSQYLLGYYPSNLRRDGSFRRIQVTVPGHGYVVRTRTGYYDTGKQ